MNWILGVRDKAGSLAFAGATGKSQCQSRRQESYRFGGGGEWAGLGKLSCL